MLLGRILRSPDGGEGGGGAAPEPKVEDKGPDLVKAVEGLIARHGDSTAALRVLLGENHSHRDKIRELTSKIPQDGSVVLTGDDSKRWSHYRELGDPSELRKALTERDQYKTDADGLRRAEVHRRAAEVSGFKAGVLDTLVERDKLAVEVVEEKDKFGKPVIDKDGRAVQVAVVRGDGDTVTKLADYASERWADFLPALKGTPPERPNGTPAIGRQRIPTTPEAGGQRATGPVSSIF